MRYMQFTIIEVGKKEVKKKTGQELSRNNFAPSKI